MDLEVRKLYWTMTLEKLEKGLVKYIDTSKEKTVMCLP